MNEISTFDQILLKMLINSVNQLEQNVLNFDKINKNVSISSVGWQIGHCLLVINGVSKQLKISDPKNFKPKFNFKRFLIFTFKKIPRGKARAPQSVQPQEEFTQDELFEKIITAKQLISDLNNLDHKCNFNHPYFGMLNVKQTIIFLEIHTHHHLKIIKDIMIPTKL